MQRHSAENYYVLPMDHCSIWVFYCSYIVKTTLTFILPRKITPISDSTGDHWTSKSLLHLTVLGPVMEYLKYLCQVIFRFTFTAVGMLCGVL